MNAEQILTEAINDVQDELHPGEALDPVTIITLITEILELIRKCRNPEAALRHIRGNTIQSRAIVRRAASKAQIPLWRRWKFADTLAARGATLSVEQAMTLVDEAAELPPDNPSSSGNWWPGVMSLLILMLFGLSSTLVAEDYWPTEEAEYWPSTVVVSETEDAEPVKVEKAVLSKKFKNPGEIIYYFGSADCVYCPPMKKLANQLYVDGYNVQNVEDAKPETRDRLEKRYQVNAYPQFVTVDADTKEVIRRKVGITVYEDVIGEKVDTYPSSTQEGVVDNTRLPYSPQRWTWPGNTRQSLINHLRGEPHGFSDRQLEGMTYEQLINLHNGDHEVKRGRRVQYFQKESYPRSQTPTRRMLEARPRRMAASCPSC